MLTTTQVAKLAGTTRHTVEREIHRGNLTAEKAGRLWVITPDEAERWSAQFQPYASLRGSRPPQGPAPDAQAEVSGTVPQ